MRSGGKLYEFQRRLGSISELSTLEPKSVSNENRVVGRIFFITDDVS